MEWSKIKNIILVMLLIVNLMLLSLVTYREYRSRRYDGETLDWAVQLLASNGISIQTQLPQASYLPVLQLDSTIWSAEEQRQQAAELVGEILGQEDSGGMRTIYRGALGSVGISADGRFTVELEAGAVPLEGDSAAQGARLLNWLGVPAIASGQVQQEDLLTLSYWQSWNGVPLFTCRCTVLCREGSVYSLNGQRLTGSATPVDTQQPLTIPTVLVRFLSGMTANGYVCSAITDMTLGYSAASSAGRLTPVWYIATDTGTYYVNAVTGVFSQSEP